MSPLQVTLCDPMWHVSSRSGVATLRAAIHLLLTYLLLKDEESARDNRVLACNFAKYLPIKKNSLTGSAICSVAGS